MIFTRARELGGDEPFAKMFARAREPFPTKHHARLSCSV
jgi:hypothetical protein